MKSFKNSVSPLVTAALFLAAGMVSAAPPTRVPSFGPNGTKWPGLIETPFMHDAAAHNIEVNCDWAAIETALSQVTANMAAAGVRILVRPGTLTGLGAGLGSNSVVRNVGSSAWTKRVTVCPKDGYGSVTINNGFKFNNVRSVCFAGFYCTQGFYLLDCDQSALAWSRFNGFSAVHAQAPGSTTSKVELSELVWPEAITTNADVLQLISNSGAITGFRVEGLWMAPHYYVAGTEPRPHTDTFQIYRVGGGTYQNINLTLRDSVIFGSNNAAIQTGGTDGLTLTNILVIGGNLGKEFYPVTPNGESSELFCPINGAGQNWTVTDSNFFGPIQLSNPGGGFSNQPFNSVTNSRVSEPVNSFMVPKAGSWTRVTSASTYTALVTFWPDDSYLRRIWSNRSGGVDPPSDGVRTSAGEGWKNLAKLTRTQDFSFRFDATPHSASVDGVTGLSRTTATAYPDLAVALRFSTAGLIEGRDGGTYRALNTLRYQPGSTYRMHVTVDFENRTYSATVTPPGGSPIEIARDFSFRTEQIAVEAIANVGTIALVGSQTISNIQSVGSPSWKESPFTVIK